MKVTLIKCCALMLMLSHVTVGVASGPTCSEKFTNVLMAFDAKLNDPLGSVMECRVTSVPRKHASVHKARMQPVIEHIVVTRKGDWIRVDSKKQTAIDDGVVAVFILHDEKVVYVRNHAPKSSIDQFALWKKLVEKVGKYAQCATGENKESLVTLNIPKSVEADMVRTMTCSLNEADGTIRKLSVVYDSECDVASTVVDQITVRKLKSTDDVSTSALALVYSKGKSVLPALKSFRILDLRKKSS